MADTIIDDPLHGFCLSGSTCTNISVGGQSTIQVQSGPGQVHGGFTISPGPQSGTELLAIAVPTNLLTASQAAAEVFKVQVDKGGAANNVNGVTYTSTLHAGTWTTSTNFLDTFLG